MVRRDARRRSPTRTTPTSTRCSCWPAGRPTPTGDDLDDRITQPPARRLRPRRSAPTPASARPPTRCCASSRATAGSSASATTTSPLEPDAVRGLVEELYRSNAGIVGPKLVDVGRPRRAPARRPRPRPLRRGRPDHRAGRVRPGAARRRPRRVRRCRRRACSCAPTCSARSAGSTRRSRSTATTSTCAGAPTSAAPASSSRRRPGCATARSSRSAGPTSTTTLLRARHRMRSVATLTGGGRLPLRSLELVAAHGRRARRRAVHRTPRRGVGVAAGVRRPDPAHARRCSPGAARSPRSGRVGDAEILGLQNRGSARLTSLPAGARHRDVHRHSTPTSGAGGRARSARPSPGSSWSSASSSPAARSSTRRSRASASSCRCPPAPATGGATSRPAWNPGGLGATVANPTGWAVLSIASVLWLFRMGLA